MQDLSGFDNSQQARILGMRQQQQLESPFGPIKSAPSSPEAGPLQRGPAAMGRQPPGGPSGRRKTAFQNIDLSEEASLATCQKPCIVSRIQGNLVCWPASASKMCAKSFSKVTKST